MTIAANLPKTNLDIRGDRLRYLLADALNECEAQYRRGANDKVTSLTALLNAAQTKLNTMQAIGLLSIGVISGDDKVTDEEAGSNVTVTVTSANFSGNSLTVTVDGATNAGVTVSSVSGNSATITMTTEFLTALSKATHVLAVSGVDGAGIKRTNSRSFVRSES